MHSKWLRTWHRDCACCAQAGRQVAQRGRGRRLWNSTAAGTVRAVRDVQRSLSAPAVGIVILRVCLRKDLGISLIAWLHLPQVCTSRRYLPQTQLHSQSPVGAVTPWWCAQLDLILPPLWSLTVLPVLLHATSQTIQMPSDLQIGQARDAPDNRTCSRCHHGSATSRQDGPRPQHPFQCRSCSFC